MSRSQASLDQILAAHIQTLALTLRPGTVNNYRYVSGRFLRYLYATFPQIRRLSQLRRDPHLLGWLATTAFVQQHPRLMRPQTLAPRRIEREHVRFVHCPILGGLKPSPLGDGFSERAAV